MNEHRMIQKEKNAWMLPLSKPCVFFFLSFKFSECDQYTEKWAGLELYNALQQKFQPPGTDPFWVFFFSETTVYHSQQSDYKLFFKFKLKMIVTIRRSA